jgi:ubiquinone/menaquinone biosynthesis C-methylase UbiE
MVTPHLAALFDDDGSSVLDFGCNDGSMALAIQAQRPSLTFQGVDIQDFLPCRIPRTIYDGRRLPFADSSFDVAMAVDVLHHTPDILASLKELARVSRRYVILKEHAAEGPISRFMVGLGDVVSNLPYGIHCTYNYPSLAQWNEHFAAAGLTVAQFRDDLPLGRICNPRQNPIFKLAKQ